MTKDVKIIREELSRPFAPEDLEWRIQVTSRDKTSGLAVPYVTNRAIQDRLDEVVGPENWCNEYQPWHGNEKKEAQICGISIYFEGKGFITKWDGAEDSDIEPVKGGLSDSMKRAAVQWGIGRVLYKMTKPVWVGIEQKGNSFVIRDGERPRLNEAYLTLLDKLHLIPAEPGAAQAKLTYRRESENGTPQNTKKPQPEAVAEPLPLTTRQLWQYVVVSSQMQQDMSGRPMVCAVLQNAEGKQAKVYAQGTHPSLTPGAQLYDAQLTLQKQGDMAFYVLGGYKLLQQAA